MLSFGNSEPAEPAQWKRYRGGAGGKIWYSPDGSRYTRIFPDVGNNLVNPMFVGPRVVFMSDHEGTGALNSALPDGTDLRRHTDLGQYYARHATTDGQRVHGAANQHSTVAYRDVACRPVVEPASRSAQRHGKAQVFLLACWPEYEHLVVADPAADCRERVTPVGEPADRATVRGRRIRLPRGAPTERPGAVARRGPGDVRS